jgi:ABC-type multidrug transport system ATPase subunit
MLARAHLQGIPASHLKADSLKLLDDVKLTSAAKMKTMVYSGGMRRRLSVAIALLGDPLIVYLDEPTTGMDPISRRHVWDIIGGSLTPSDPYTLSLPVSINKW